MDNNSRKKEVTPNRGGLVCNEKDSPKIQREIRKWESIRKKKNPKLDNSVPYWKLQSSFNAL